uniref:Ribosome biogenesis protein YTM1 n=1 Tax=Sexangularia sp. CB-2014 TaxID=1486929 RepID=A0A7S1VPH6_9EUKA|mmetsp:Transcript_7506/g.23999  ORF Transcript_7506/g.23999 Transcript_7506/m.23999 type:complete len:469 (+) Transcript_7506:87-1493(+)
MSEISSASFQLKFYSTAAPLQALLADLPIVSVPASLSRHGLTDVLAHLTSEARATSGASLPSLHFFIGQRLLRSTLAAAAQAVGALAEHDLPVQVEIAPNSPSLGENYSVADRLSAVTVDASSGDLIVGDYKGFVRRMGLDGVVRHTDATGNRQVSHIVATATFSLATTYSGTLVQLGVTQRGKGSSSAASSAPVVATFDNAAMAVAAGPDSVSAVGTSRGIVHFVSLREDETKGGAKRKRQVAEAPLLVGEETGTFRGHVGAPVGGIVWPVRDRLYTVGHDCTVRSLDPATLGQVSALTGHAPLGGLSYSLPAGLLYAGGPQRRVRSFDPRSGGRTAAVYTSHLDSVTSTATHPTSSTHFASASLDGTVKIWDARATVPLYTLRAHGGEAVTAIAWAGEASDALVSVGADGRVQVTRYALEAGATGGRRSAGGEGGEGGDDDDESASSASTTGSDDDDSDDDMSESE